MEGQHSYEISLKKDELFINLSSDDVYFISKQMDKWFRILLDDSYVPVSLPPRPQPTAPAPVQPSVAPAEPATAVVQEEAPAHQPAAPPPPVETTAPSTPEPQAVMPQPPVQPIPEAAEPAAPATEPEAPVAAQALPETVAPPEPVAVPEQPAAPEVLPVATQPEPPVEPQPTPPAEAAAPQPLPTQPSAPTPLPTDVKDDFEAVMDTLMKDLEEPALPEPQVTAPPPASAPVVPLFAQAAAQEEVEEQAPLAENPNTLQEVVDLGLVNSLADLCDQANAGSAEDYLLLASYFLNQFEGQEAFSLKRINSNLVKSGLTPVNHSVLEAVLTKGYLSMVPDMTGTAEVSEYTLTDQGMAVTQGLF